MGYKLRRALRVALGAEIAGLQRAVALEIADDANDDTRMSLASLEDLALWTAAKDENVVRNALKRLAAAGWEFRVPLGKGKDGRVLYAVPGRRLTFRVPEFQGVSVATPKGESPLPQGVAPAPSEGAPAPSERAPATPFSSVPSVPSSLSTPAEAPSSMAAASEREKEHPEQTEDGERIVRAYINGRREISLPTGQKVAAQVRADAEELLAEGYPAQWLCDRAREMARRAGWTDLRKHCDRSGIPATQAGAQPTATVESRSARPCCVECDAPFLSEPPTDLLCRGCRAELDAALAVLEA